MKDDYLWDKSGTPDSEIEQLEQLLGNLRYRRPAAKLPLPQIAPVNRRHRFAPAFAIAAALAFVLVAAGVWFIFNNGEPKAATGIAAISLETGGAHEWLSPDRLTIFASSESEKDESKPPRELVASNPPRRDRLSRSPNQTRGTTAVAIQLTKSNRPEVSDEEGVAAREQLIKALHLASAKLNQVQKKVQENKSPGPVS